MSNKRMQRVWALALTTMSLLCFTRTAEADERAFSAPITEPERALHAILQWEMQEWELKLKPPRNDLADFLRQLPRRNTQRDREFQSKFTDALVQSITAADQAGGRANCDGACGVDYDPILCAQDILIPPHSYLTTSKAKGNDWPDNVAATAYRAYVRYRRGEANDPYAHRIDYLMEKQLGRWKIAGINCIGGNGYGGSKFNIP